MRLGIFGPQGSGKSLFAMILARRLQQIDPNIDIYSNMNATGGIIRIEDLAEISFKDGKNKILIVDEAMFSINSRNTNSKQNAVWSKALALFRKSDFVLVIFITHRPRMIDVNMREQLDYLLMCRKNPMHFDYLLYETISDLTIPIQIPKMQEIFNFANFDTKDFPLPIQITELEKQPLFQILK